MFCLLGQTKGSMYKQYVPCSLAGIQKIATHNNKVDAKIYNKYYCCFTFVHPPYQNHIGAQLPLGGVDVRDHF